MKRAAIYLHEEILIEIFSRLPAKSVGVCRCLSISWNRDLSTQTFIKLHLSRRTQDNNLILIRDYWSHKLTIPAIKASAVSKDLNLVYTRDSVLGSCDGLVLLRDRDGVMYVVNPIMQRKVKIPFFPRDVSENCQDNLVGFGYDSSTDDYKIVLLCYSGLNSGTLVRVYSMKASLWKTLCIPCNLDGVVPSSVYASGAIHWMVASQEPPYKYLIVSFDLAKEIFVEIPTPPKANDVKFIVKWLKGLKCVDIPPPPNANNRSLDTGAVFVVGGCLCMIDDTVDHNFVDVWILKDYGCIDSWTKFRVDRSHRIICGIKPLCLLENEDVVMFESSIYGKNLIVSNLTSGNTRYMVVDGVCFTKFMDGRSFVDSLVSPMSILRD